MLLYALFFVLCRLLAPRWWLLALVSAFRLFVVSKFYVPIGHGISSFFVGGCALRAYRRITASGAVRIVARWFALATGVA